MSGLECGGHQPQAVLGWRSQCLSASSTGLCVLARLACMGMCYRAAVFQQLSAGTNVRQLVVKPPRPIIHRCQVLLLLSRHCSALCSTHGLVSTPSRDHGHHTSKGQDMTGETMMSQTAHCWHLYWYFWLVVTSLKGTGGKIFARHFSLLISALAPNG